MKKNYLAIDLGAESGRTILGTLAAEKLVLSEIHRFPNQPVRLPGGFHWDILRLWAEVKAGIAKAVKSGVKLDSLGIDAWGVDFALLDRDGNLLGNPYHYRDHRTEGMIETAFHRLPRERIFAQTGCQFSPINSLYQLLSLAENNSPVLSAAQTFLTIPDLLNFWLTGRKVCEFTNATTTQCYDPRWKTWAVPLLEKMSIPTHIFPEIVPPGTILGRLRSSVAEETGAPDLPVVAPACHDTGSAVVAVPAENQDFAWLSSGTWSVLGAEVRQPCLTEKALAYNLTNEGGVFGTWRLSKNILGLWLIQECRRAWQHQGEDYSYDAMSKLAAESDPFIAVIDPDDASFFRPGDMPQKVQDFCQETGQRVPQSHGEIVRVVLESLALKYRFVLERLDELTGTRLAPLHIIGGGTQNRLLNQFTADATGRKVVTGPIEATAIGNLLMQAIALGHLANLSEARAVVRASFSPEIYASQPDSRWDEAYGKLLTFV